MCRCVVLLCILGCTQAFSQLRPLSMEESAGRVALLRCVDFEGETNSGPRLRTGGIVFAGIEGPSECQGCDPANPDAAPAVILLQQGQFADGEVDTDYDSDLPRFRGGTMTFLHLPRYVVIQTLNIGPGRFEFRVTLGDSQRINVQRASFASSEGDVGHAYFGLEATRGIRRMELVRYEDGGTGPLQIDAVYVTKVATPTNLVAKTIRSDQVNLKWKHRGGDDPTGFLIERGTEIFNFTQIAEVGPDVRSFEDTTVSPTNRYLYRVRANHPDGESAYSNTATARTRGPESRLRLRSIAGEDGFVCEELALINRGERAFADEAGGAALIAGDQRQNQQCKAIISFDTSALPDTAEIISAVLILRQGARSGNPVATLGRVLADINSGEGFGDSPALRPDDFEADADGARVAVLQPARGDVRRHIGRIRSSAFGRISTTGRTQFRIYFAQPDDGDFAADFLGWHSGESGSNAPVLDIMYRGGTEPDTE